MEQQNITSILADYSVGDITRQDLFLSIVQLAQSASDYNSLVEDLPGDCLVEFSSFVAEYLGSASTVQVGSAPSAIPSPEAIAGLGAALSRKLARRGEDGAVAQTSKRND